MLTPVSDTKYTSTVAGAPATSQISEPSIAEAAALEKNAKPPDLTWAVVQSGFIAALKADGRAAQEKNFKTAIKFWLVAIGKTEDSLVGEELAEEFEAKLKVYVDFQINRRNKEITYGPRVSKMRTVKQYVEQNFAPILALQTLPKTFSQRLLKLILALGITVRGFWRTLPKGILAYGTLIHWCQGRTLPSIKFLSVVKTIEEHLQVPVGTLRPPQYRRIGHDLRIGQSDSGNKTRAAFSKPYYVWTKTLEEELQRLSLHKTAGILPEGEERSECGRWTSNEDGEIHSYKKTKDLLQSFMGFCALPEDSPDPYLKGAGIKLENLSLTLLTDKQLVEGYLAFMKLRSGLRVRPIDDSTATDMPPHKISANGLWEFYDKGGKYNKGSIYFLCCVLSLLRPKTGYLYQHAEYAEKLEARMTADTWEQQCERTRGRVKTIYKSILKMQKERDKEHYDFGRDPKELIQWILDLPHPLFILQDMIRAMLEDLLPGSATLLERARQYRNLVLVALLCANPLRIGMFSRMKFGENLIRRSDGSWWLQFHRKSFKNRRSLKSDYLVCVAKELWPMLDRYKEEFHPVLTSSTKSTYVFVGAGKGRYRKETGLQMSETTLSTITRQLTSLYIPGSIGFRPQTFRHIIATDIIKKDPRFGFFLASIALHDKYETVQEEYAHLKTSELFEPVNRHFSESWSSVFGSSRVDGFSENHHPALPLAIQNPTFL